MSLNTTTYSVAPYHDDYDENKGFLKILFKPGVSVQTRELNQLQTNLQDQINRMGQHFFEDGSPVIDGGVNIDTSVDFIDVIFTDATLKVTAGSSPITTAQVRNRIAQLIRSTTYNNAGIYAQEDTVTVTNGSAKEVEADILSHIILSETTELTKYRFFIRYTRKSIGFDKFNPQTSLKTTSSILDTDDTILVDANDTVGTIDKVGTCTRISALEGVYFVDGFFIKLVNQETLIENPQVDLPITGNISFKAEQTIVNFSNDASLLDNATGTPNQQAPGADRYKISLTVVLNTDQNEYLNIPFNSNKVFNLTPQETSLSQFITVQEYINGKPVNPVLAKYNPETNRFANSLAKRTFEESGSYCLNPFVVDIREAFNDGGNRGRFEADTDAQTQALKANYSIGIEPSVAYVEGYRVETLNRKEILAPKARDREIGEDVTLTSGTGLYVEGVFNTTGSGVVLPTGGDTLNVLSTTNGASTTAGNVTFNALEKISGSKYRLYFSLDTATVSQIVSAYHIGTTGTSTDFRFTAAGTASSGSRKFTQVFGQSTTSKILELPRDLVSNVDSTNLKVTKIARLSSTTAGSGTITSITLSAPSNETFYSTRIDDYIVHNETDNEVETPTGVVINQASNQIVVSFGSALGNSKAIKLYAPTKASFALGTKTLNTSGSVTSATPAPGTVIALSQIDVIEITSITSSDSNDVINLSDFVLDNGQRESSYTNATLTYNGSSTPAGTLTIKFNYFDHSSTSDQYFSVNSYPETFDYEKIPSFNNRRLSDVLDFRTAQSPTLIPNTIVDAKIDYYLPRIDQLIVTARGKFAINKGIPSLSPQIPDTPQKSLALYNIFLPAYTFDAGRIKLDYIDNRRYTMRDIGALDKKVKNLEYYTSLSLLEKEASDKKIFGENGERFKTGILVDSFTGHNVGDVRDPGYKCAIDGSLGVLRPSYEINNISFGITNNTQTEDLVRLPSVSTVDLIKQNKASVHESLMPYDVVTYQGSLKLSPSSDDWQEVNRRPDVIVNFDGNLDAIEFLAKESEALGTQWNAWETSWTGVSTSNSIGFTRNFERPVSSTVFNTEGSSPRTLDTIQRTVTDRVEENVTVTTTTTNTQQIRSGTRTSLDVSTIKEVLGDRIVDIGFVPFIRSRRIYFKGEGLKPNTKLYAYFDEVNVSGYCTKIGVIGMGTSASHTFEERRFRKLPKGQRIDFFNKNATEAFSEIGDTHQDLVTDSLGNIEGYFIIPNTSQVRFPTGDRTFKLSDYSGGIDDQYATSIAKATYSARGLLTTNENTIVSTRKVNFNQDRIRDARTLSRTTVDVNSSENVVQVIEDEVIGTVTLPDPRPTVLLSRNAPRVDEGGEITITLTTTNLEAGSTVAYTVTNMEAEDYSGTPAGFTQGANDDDGTGTFTIGNDGTSSLTWNIATDGDDTNETFVLSLDDFDQRISVVVGDTTQEAAPEPPAPVTPIRRIWRRDPIAQTFQLSDVNNEEGAFIKEIDLFFKSKHPTLPVTLQVVTVENGTPTSAVVPFGEITIPAASINVSETSATATTFAFDAPIYLQPEQEYAFIVRSNSVENRIWLSKLGDNDLISGKKIDKQPAVGVALKSANASTWTPMQDKDIKFTLKALTFMSDSEKTRRRIVGPGSITETGTASIETILPVGIDNSNKIKATALKLQAEKIILPKTDIEFNLRVPLSSGYRNYKITPNQTIYLDEQIQIGTEEDIVLTPTFETKDKFLSPVLDLDRLSIVTINNVVNNDITDETTATHGDAQARYITRLVKLENPADNITMYMGVNRPSSETTIEVYARTSENGTFTKLNIPNIPVSSSKRTFREIEIEHSPGTDITEFQIKIVILSTNSAKVCTINDFRAIATIEA